MKFLFTTRERSIFKTLATFFGLMVMSASSLANGFESSNIYPSVCVAQCQWNEVLCAKGKISGNQCSALTQSCDQKCASGAVKVSFKRKVALDKKAIKVALKDAGENNGSSDAHVSEDQFLIQFPLNPRKRFMEFSVNPRDRHVSVNTRL